MPFVIFPLSYLSCLEEVMHTVLSLSCFGDLALHRLDNIGVKGITPNPMGCRCRNGRDSTWSGVSQINSLFLFNFLYFAVRSQGTFPKVVKVKFRVFPMPVYQNAFHGKSRHRVAKCAHACVSCYINREFLIPHSGYTNTRRGVEGSPRN